MIPPNLDRPEWAVRRIKPEEFVGEPVGAARSLIGAALGRWVRRRTSRGVNNDTLGINLETATRIFADPA